MGRGTGGTRLPATSMRVFDNRPMCTKQAASPDRVVGLVDSVLATVLVFVASAATLVVISSLAPLS